MPSGETEEGDSDSVDGAGMKIEVFEVEGVLFHYTREVEDMMTTIVSCRAHHSSVCKETVHF